MGWGVPRPTWVVPRHKSQVASRRTKDAARLAARLATRAYSRPNESWGARTALHSRTPVGGGRGGLSTQVLLLSRTVTQGASGLAGRLAALNASLRLGFRRNSEEFRNSTELKRHNKRTGKRQARHAIPPARRICTAVSACFPLAAFQLPAPCLLCGRLPHSSTISRSSHVRYDATVTGQYRRFPMPNPPSPTGERTV